MFGDKRLEMPGTVGEAWEVLKQFGIKYNGTDLIFKNACRLVELNNEVYERQMKYKVIKDIPSEDGVEGAQKGDVLLVGWYKDKHCGRWALSKDGKYICDLGSRCERYDCVKITPSAD